MFNLDQFINTYVTHRPESMFLKDIESHREELEKAIRGKEVLVIGGAGSIGSSFIRAILPFRPAGLVVVDTNENALAELTRDLRSTPGMFVPEDYVPYPMDFSSATFRKMFLARAGARRTACMGAASIDAGDDNRTRINSAPGAASSEKILPVETLNDTGVSSTLTEAAPSNRCRAPFDIVANFSAHKHVRSEKDIYSVEALLTNNVLHARGLLELLKEYPPEMYFCVSTDKAANPVNIMGASKRIMEDVIFSYSEDFPVKTARFANVAFSNGSLPDGFLHRIAKLQPLSAPSDVRRYFVSPEESGQICMLAAMLGQNREIFFPKLQEAQMGKFDQIARDLLHEYGFEVLECASDEEAAAGSAALKNGSRQYPVHFAGSNTSGEKQYEEFYTDAESVTLDRFGALGVVTGKTVPDKAKIDRLFERLEAAFDDPAVTKDDIVAIMQEYLPNFEHIETGKSLDSKM